MTDVSDHLTIFGLVSLSNSCKNPYRNTYRRVFHESKKDAFLGKLKVNLEKDDLERLDPNLLTDKIIFLYSGCNQFYFSIEKSF